MTHESYILNHNKLTISGGVGLIGPWSYGTVNNKGFTLVELIVVCAILGLLATVAIPALNNYVNSTKTKRAMAEIRNLSTDISSYSIDNGKYPDSLTNLRPGNFLDPWQRPYVYNNIIKNGGAIKDLYNVDLNKDYDLYSLGPNGATAVVGGVPATDDDIVRYNDGTFVGLR